MNEEEEMDSKPPAAVEDEELLTDLQSIQLNNANSGDSEMSSSFAVETSEDDSPLFQRTITNSYNKNFRTTLNAQTSCPGAFRVAGMNRNVQQHSTPHDTPARPIPFEDTVSLRETVEHVATLTAVTVDTPVIVDSGAVTLVLSEPEEKQDAFPHRNRLLTWGMILLLVLLTIVISLTWFLRSKDRPTKLLIAPTMTPTPSPTSSSLPERVEWLLQNNISDQMTLLQRDSPQAKAVAWWASETNSHKALQRYVLAVFYFAMGGERWRSCGQGHTNCSPAGQPQNWLHSDTLECQWIGVTCDAMGSVIGLDFESLKSITADPDHFVELQGFRIRLDGEIPPEIRHLTSLQEFVAPNMNVQGSLALWKDLDQLRVFNVEHNAIEGSISSQLDVNHPALELFNVRNNVLTGTLPTTLGNLNALHTLDLASNQLKGAIPSSLGLFPKLESLRLSGNQLQGQVPLSLFRNTKLKVLALGRNEALSGSIPTFVGNMSSLEVLDLHATRFQGELPPELFLLPNLRTLDLSDAQFHGVVTEDIRLLCDTLRVLRLNDNDFSGSIPVALDECKQLEELVLTNTGITGEVSETLCRKRGSSALQLSVLNVDCAVACNCCGKRNCPQD